MLYREIIAVCSEIHTKHISILCVQATECLNVKASRIPYGLEQKMQQIKRHSGILPKNFQKKEHPVVQNGRR
jgi:hypothetical protein